MLSNPIDAPRFTPLRIRGFSGSSARKDDLCIQNQKHQSQYSRDVKHENTQPSTLYNLSASSPNVDNDRFNSWRSPHQIRPFDYNALRSKSPPAHRDYRSMQGRDENFSYSQRERNGPELFKLKNELDEEIERKRREHELEKQKLQKELEQLRLQSQNMKFRFKDASNNQDDDRLLKAMQEYVGYQEHKQNEIDQSRNQTRGNSAHRSQYHVDQDDANYLKWTETFERKTIYWDDNQGVMHQIPMASQHSRNGSQHSRICSVSNAYDSPYKQNFSLYTPEHNINLDQQIHDKLSSKQSPQKSSMKKSLSQSSLRSDNLKKSSKYSQVRINQQEVMKSAYKVDLPQEIKKIKVVKKVGKKGKKNSIDAKKLYDLMKQIIDNKSMNKNKNLKVEWANNKELDADKFLEVCTNHASQCGSFVKQVNEVVGK